jgi:3-oxoadipate enol-lactonase
VARLQALRARLPETAEEVAAMFFPEPFLLQRPELRRIFANVQAASARTLRRHAAVDSSLAIDWSQLGMPVLLMTGELDQVVPPAVTLGIAAHLAHSQQVVLPGVGHATALQAPEAVAAHLVRFLTAPQSTH